MQHSQDLNFFLANPVGNGEGQSRYNKFSRSFDPAGAPQGGLVLKQRDELEDSMPHGGCRMRIVPPYIFADFREVLKRFGIPSYFHSGGRLSFSVPQDSSHLLTCS
jgi:hypothetical protein